MSKIIKIAICDDDPGVSEELEQYIQKINLNSNITIRYDIFYKAEAIYCYENETYDAYILDIELEEMSGFELAQKIRESNCSSQILFLTSHSEYVYDSFSVNPFDYLIKPLNYQLLFDVMVRLSNYIINSKMFFQFSYDRENHSIPCKEITYVDKVSRKAFIHLTNGEYRECNMPIRLINEQLNMSLFAPVRKSCIVNLDAIKKIEGNILTLQNGEQLIISRKYVNQIKKSHLMFLEKYYF